MRLHCNDHKVFIPFMDRLAVYSVKDYIKENMVLNDCENYLKGICNLARFSLNKRLH